MIIVSTSYSKSKEFSSPHEWLKRISFYTGILEELAKKNSVHSIERINYTGNLEQNRVHYHFIRLSKTVERFPVSIHRCIRPLKPDIVLVNGMIFPLQIMQLKMNVRRNTKIIVLHRAEKPFKGIKKFLQKAADKFIDAYLFTSEEFGEQWINTGIIQNKKKIFEVVQSSSAFIQTDKQQARQKLNIIGENIYLWVGRLEKNKDPLTVVHSFIEFSKINADAQLYMIFQTEELLADIQKLLAEQKVNTIHLAGRIDHDHLGSWYSAADFIISGSHYEGSGIAVIEAMSCGCIPILTNIVSFRKLSLHHEFLYEAGNARHLLEILQKTVSIDRKKLSEDVRNRFQKEFSFSAIAEKVEHIINLQS